MPSDTNPFNSVRPGRHATIRYIVRDPACDRNSQQWTFNNWMALRTFLLHQYPGAEIEATWSGDWDDLQEFPPEYGDGDIRFLYPAGRSDAVLVARWWARGDTQHKPIEQIPINDLAGTDG